MASSSSRFSAVSAPNTTRTPWPSLTVASLSAASWSAPSPSSPGPWSLPPCPSPLVPSPLVPSPLVPSPLMPSPLVQSPLVPSPRALLGCSAGADASRVTIDASMASIATRITPERRAPRSAGHHGIEVAHSRGGCSGTAAWSFARRSASSVGGGRTDGSLGSNGCTVGRQRALMTRWIRALWSAAQSAAMSSMRMRVRSWCCSARSIMVSCVRHVRCSCKFASSARITAVCASVAGRRDAASSTTMENVEADARTPHAEGAVAEAMAARSRLESSTRSSSESSARADDGRRGARGGIRRLERQWNVVVNLLWSQCGATCTHDYQTFPPPYLSKVMASPRRATSSPVWATVDWAHVPAAVLCRASLGAPDYPRRPERRSRARIDE